MDDLALVQLANEVLSKLPGSPRVEHWTEINSRTFVKLYEGLFAEALPDVIPNPKSREDEIHNIQSVIDTLSLDVLNTSLSHLSGDSIVSGNKESIKSLMEVFHWLFEYILDKIGSETSTDGGEITESKLTDVTDPDLVTSEVIDSILEKELGKNYSSLREHGSGSKSKRPSSGRSSRNGQNSTAELMALGYTSSATGSRNASMDRTEDLIALGNSRQAAKSPKKKSSYKNKPSPKSRTINGSGFQGGRGNIGEISPKSKSLGRDPYPLDDFSRDSSRNLLTGDLSSIRMQDSLDLSQGISTNGYRRSDFATRGKTEMAGSSSNGAVNGSSPARSSGYGQDLSSGPLSDTTENGYKSKDLLGKETTADLIRESESIERRLGLRPPYEGSSDWTTPKDMTTQSHQRTPGVDSSMASSMSYPKAVMPEPGGRSSQFAHIGAGVPRSLTEPLKPSIGHKDNLSNSVPLGHQYHSFTHHLYHHYPPGGGIAQGVGLGSSVVEPYHRPSSVQEGQLTSSAGLSESLPNSETISTQVTPGRFLEGDLKVTNDPDQLSKTVPTRRTESKTARPISSKSYSYDNLRYMLQDTMKLSESAVKNSPLKDSKKAASAVHLNDDLTDDELSQRLRKTLQKFHSSEDSNTDKSRSLIEQSLTKPSTVRQENVRPEQSILSPKGKKTGIGRSSRKVSFLTSRPLDRTTTTDSDLKDSTLESPMESPPIRSFEAAKQSRAKTVSPRIGQLKNIYGKTSVRKGAPSSKMAKSKAGLGKNVVNRRAERLAHTADEYFEKYYGSPRPRVSSSLTTDDSLLHSDRDINSSRGDSSPDIDYRGDIQAEIEEYKRQLRKRAKQVRFDDILDDSAPGHMAGIRRKLMKEEQKTRFRSEFLKDLYDQELMDYEDGIEDQMKKLKNTSKETNKEYKKKVLKSPKPCKHKQGWFYSPKTSVLLPKSKARNRTIPQSHHRKRSASASPAVGHTRGISCDHEILPWLLEQFPYLHVSPETLHDLWRKSAKQIEVLSKTDQYAKAKKKRAEQEIEQAEQKQKLLSEISKKELSHNDRMRELEQRKKQQYAVKSSIRDKRQQHARVRKYYDEYHVRMRSKMLKKRNREEMIFKKLFDEGLKIQKDRIRDLRKYAKDQRESRARKQRDELESIENFYRDRFTLLAEALEEEKQEKILKNKAQKKILQTMNREFRKKTEKEIETIQDQIFRDEDDEYFRQIDADRLRQQLNLARYKARV